MRGCFVGVVALAVGCPRVSLAALSKIFLKASLGFTKEEVSLDIASFVFGSNKSSASGSWF